MKYKETSLATLSMALSEWLNRWESETYEGSDEDRLPTALIAYDDGSDKVFPDKAVGLWVVLDTEGFVAYFLKKEQAVQYVLSDEQVEVGKVEI